MILFIYDASIICIENEQKLKEEQNMSENATRIKINKLYKSPCIIFDDYPIGDDGKTSKSTGRLITCLDTKLDSLKTIMNSEDLDYRLVRSFYVDRKWSYTINGNREQVDYTAKQKKDHESVKDKCDRVTVTHNSPGNYKGANLYYGMYAKLEPILKSVIFDGNSTNIKKQIELFKQFFKSTISGSPIWKSYDLIDFYIPISKNSTKITSVNDLKSTGGAKTILDIIYAIIATEGISSLTQMLSETTSRRVNVYMLFMGKESHYFYKIPSNTSDVDLTKMIKSHKSLRLAALAENNKGNIKGVDVSEIKKITNNNIIHDKNISKRPYKGRVDPVVRKLLSAMVGDIAAEGYVSGKSTTKVEKLGDKLTESAIRVRDVHGSTYSESEDAEVEKELVDTTSEEVSEALEEYETKIAPTMTREQIKKLNKAKTISETVVISRPDISAVQIAKEKEFASEKIVKTLYNETTYDKTISSDALKRCDDAYYYGTYQKDIMRMLTCWDRPTNMFPLHLQSAEFIQTSDGMTKKEDLKVKFIDSSLVTHTFRVAIPKVIESNKIMKGGNIYTMYKQAALFPVVKTSPNEVQLVSNQQKCFISRSGDMTSLGVDIISTFLKDKNKYPSVAKLNVKEGKCAEGNIGHAVHVDYASLGNYFYKIKTPKYTVIFDQSEIRDRVADKTVKMDLDGRTVVAIDNKTGEPIISNANGIIVFNDTEYRISEWLYYEVICSIPACKEEIQTIRSTRKLSYSQVTILSRKFPLIYMLSHLYGITTVLERCGIDYEFVDKKDRPNLNKDNARLEKRIVPFKDGYLVYTTKDTANELLMAGLYTLKTAQYRFLDLNDQDIYTTPTGIYSVLTKGSARISKGVLAFKEIFFDGITMNILDRLGLNDDILDLALLGNSMLSTTDFNEFLDMDNRRIRMPAESIAIALYHAISEEYLKYARLSYTKEIRKSITLAYNSVFRHLMNSPLIETADNTQALRELEDRSIVSFQGWGGLNIMEGYSPEKRSFHKTHLGRFSIVGSAGTIGIKRHLVVDCGIEDTRGFLAEVKYKDLKSGNILGASEAMTPFAINDDGMRRSFIFNQAVDFVNSTNPTIEPPIITGYENGCIGSLGDTYVKKAKFDGKVIEVDEKNQILKVEYTLPDKKKTTDAFSFKKHALRNGGSGIYLPNTLECLYRKGESFKAGYVLIRSNEWFHGDRNESSISFGCLAKTSLITSHRTNEDSSTMRRGFGNDLAASLIDKKSVVLGKYAVITRIAKVGDFIKAGDPVIVFENVFGDTTGAVSAMVQRIKEEEGDDSDDYKNVPSSKHSGTIIDIEILYTSPVEELGDDVKKLVKKHISADNARNKILLSSISDKDSLDIKYVGPTEINNGMIGGEHVDEGDIIIKFTIEYKDIYTVGDKASFHSAGKSVTGFTLDDENMPYGDFRPDEPMDFEVAMEAIERRLIKSPVLALYTNKVLVELKRKVAAIIKRDKTINPKTRKEIESTIVTTMQLLEPGGYNSAKYTALFKDLTESGFASYVKAKANTKGRHFQLQISSYDKNGFPMFKNIAKAAKFLNIPLEERIAYPHFKKLLGEDTIPYSATKFPVGYMMVRPPVQKVLKKEKQGVKISTRDPLSGQVTKKTKGGRLSYVDANTMVANGLFMTLREFSTIRADNMKGKSDAAEQIRNRGTLVLARLDIDTGDNISARTADQILLAGFVKSNIVTGSYKIKGDIKQSYSAHREGSNTGATSEDELRLERERKARIKGAKL